jgi:hypothetical protein
LVLVRHDKPWKNLGKQIWPNGCSPSPVCRVPSPVGDEAFQRLGDIGEAIGADGSSGAVLDPDAPAQQRVESIGGIPCGEDVRTVRAQRGIQDGPVVHM